MGKRIGGKCDAFVGFQSCPSSLYRMVDQFFPSKFAGSMSTGEIPGEISSKYMPEKCEQMMLLSGPPCCGKTSLLFQFAYNRARESSDSVVFICNKQRMENKLPFLIQGIAPSSDIFNKIQMKYLEDDEGLKKYFAAFHFHETFPTAVIIDDFGEFFHDRNCQERYGNQRGRDLAMVRTLALCRDAIDYVNGKQNLRGTCKLLLSDTHHGDSPRLLFIYKRWLPCIFTIKVHVNGSFLLSKGDSSHAVRYSISLQHLTIEEIIREDGFS
ncbi:hypothetical protein AMTRI_Chr10g232740 [Amborella trichopoda]|uniref:uncharacterized protein LOC18447508 isoform X1 n=1 Tax=Amborella trichopoda TaxID=13333 RepID=UPI0005D4317D|nr:uncharacterized protein LOC18447508 isoform X1 [Amborella trichopoda]|eukprot:XP_011628241.1 uncharacterized protein LOC18447508 isoform X1 [Amborella trichopoda]